MLHLDHVIQLTYQKWKLEFVSYQGATRPGIEFILAENHPFESANIILHSRNDLPDADLLNGLIITSISNEAISIPYVFLPV